MPEKAVGGMAGPFFFSVMCLLLGSIASSCVVRIFLASRLRNCLPNAFWVVRRAVVSGVSIASLGAG